MIIWIESVYYMLGRNQTLFHKSIFGDRHYCLKCSIYKDKFGETFRWKFNCFYKYIILSQFADYWFNYYRRVIFVVYDLDFVSNRRCQFIIFLESVQKVIYLVIKLKFYTCTINTIVTRITQCNRRFTIYIRNKSLRTTHYWWE